MTFVDPNPMPEEAVADMQDALRKAGWSECSVASAEGTPKGEVWGLFPEESSAERITVAFWELADAYDVMRGADIPPIGNVVLRKVRPIIQ